MELSNEVFEYSHKEVSGEYAGYAVDIALMKEHKDLKSEHEVMKKTIIDTYEMLSGLSYSTEEDGRKYLSGNEYPWMERAWNIIKSAKTRIDNR